MDEFVVDAGLFAKAQDKIVAASEAFSSISSLLSSVKANFPEEYEYKSEVIDACGDIDEAKSYVETFKAKVAEVCANLASLDEEFAKEVYSPKWYEDLWNAYKESGAELKRGVKSWAAGEGTGKLKKGLKDTGATIAVTGTSVLAGAGKVVEFIADGGVYAQGAVRAGIAKIGDKRHGTNNASRIWDETLDATRMDIVGTIYDTFYDTKTGKRINKASKLKADGKGAQALRTGGEFAGKVALATAATIVTGGTATPVVLGALYGVGKAEERYAQSVDREHGESYDIKRANTKAVVNAVTGAAEFYGYGQIGGMLAAKSTMKGAAGSLKDMISSGTKVEGKTFAKNFVKNFVAKDTLIDSSAVVADHVGNVYLGDESFSQALKSGGGELAFALGLNILGAGMGAYVESATPVVKNVDDIPSLKAGQTEGKYLLKGTDQEGLAQDVINTPKRAKLDDKTREWLEMKVKNMQDNKGLYAGPVTVPVSLDNPKMVEHYTNKLFDEISTRINVNSINDLCYFTGNKPNLLDAQEFEDCLKAIINENPDFVISEESKLFTRYSNLDKISGNMTPEQKFITYAAYDVLSKDLPTQYVKLLDTYPKMYKDTAIDLINYAARVDFNSDSFYKYKEFMENNSITTDMVSRRAQRVLSVCDYATVKMADDLYETIFERIVPFDEIKDNIGNICISEREFVERLNDGTFQYSKGAGGFYRTSDDNIYVNIYANATPEEMNEIITHEQIHKAVAYTKASGVKETGVKSERNYNINGKEYLTVTKGLNESITEYLARKAHPGWGYGTFPGNGPDRIKELVDNGFIKSEDIIKCAYLTHDFSPINERLLKNTGQRFDIDSDDVLLAFDKITSDQHIINVLERDSNGIITKWKFDSPYTYEEAENILNRWFNNLYMATW